MVQSATDIFVGWGSLGGRDYYVRQYRDMKIIPSTDLIAPVFVPFATACGNTLARAHARSGDAVAIDAYMGKGDSFTKALRRFALRYAEQNERDHARLVSAIRRGMVEGDLKEVVP
jgi:predicted alpha/beta hydrolase